MAETDSKDISTKEVDDTKADKTEKDVKTDENKAHSDASSDKSVGIPAFNAPQSASKIEPEKPVEQKPAEPKYSKEAILNADQFNFLDRTIIEMEVDDKAKLSISDAREIIRKFKGEE